MKQTRVYVREDCDRVKVDARESRLPSRSLSRARKMYRLLKLLDYLYAPVALARRERALAALSSLLYGINYRLLIQPARTLAR